MSTLTRVARGTPLGPGGRPLRGWRAIPTMLALVVVLANTLVLLSDRAPGLLRRLSDRLEIRASQAARLKEHVRLPKSDVEVHVLMWALATILVGLAAWSWGSLVFASVSVFGYSLLVENLQPVLTASRELQDKDLLANAVGVATGFLVVSVIALGWRAVRRRT